MSEKEMGQLTIWSSPNEIISTVEEKVTYKIWLEKEKHRIEKDGDREAEIREKGNSIALFVTAPLGYEWKNGCMKKCGRNW